jgi:cytochrome c-type biogenesis protein CcmH/NrfF
MLRDARTNRIPTGSRAAPVVAAAFALTFALASSLAAQSMTMQSMASQSRSSVESPKVEHVHRGELGDKWLVVEEAIRCNCSCGEDVHHCQFRMECDTSPAWSARMYQQLQAGKTPKEVEAGFVADFGEVVLMAPPMEGFNLLGYFLPGVAILMAGALIGLIVKGGMGKHELAPVTELGAEDAARLKEAMRKLDEAEGPDW